MSPPRHQRASHVDLLQMAARGDACAVWELKRRERLAELKREAMAEVSTCPEVKIERNTRK